MDIARWGLGINALADRVLTYGGRFGYTDAGETPNTEVSILEFGPDKTLVFEVRGRRPPPAGRKIGVIFYGSEGIFVCVPIFLPPQCSIRKGTRLKTFQTTAAESTHLY